MVEDVKMVVEGKLLVYFYGRLGGMILILVEIVEKVKKIIVGELVVGGVR